MRKLVFVLVLVLAAILLAACVVANTPQPDPQAADYSTICYREIGGAKWVCSSGGEFEVQSGATLDVQTGATFNLAGRADFDVAATQTATNSVGVTITALVNPLTSTGNVTPTITIPVAGTFGCLYNTANTSILIQDTGNQVLSGNATLGQYDWVCGWSDGTRFMQWGPEGDN